MGNHQCTPPQPIIVAPPQIRITKQRDKDLNAVRSVSNPSLVSQLEDEEEQIETSISQQFDEAYMDMIYKKYQTLTGTTESFMPPDAVKPIMNVFDTVCMDENIMYLAMKVSETIIAFDDSWGSMYSACAERNPLKYAETKGFATDNRLIVHAMMIFRTLKVITASLEEANITQVMNILDLVALSHLVMKVQATSYKSFLIAMVKNLLHFKIVSDDVLPAFVSFNLNILTSLDKLVQLWQQKHIVLLNQMFDGPTSPAREYYRELKKWRIYVLSCYKYLAKPLLSLEKQIQSAHKLQNAPGVESGSYENWKLIRCLKKGYKYRLMSENQTVL